MGLRCVQPRDKLGTREGSDPSASLRLCVFCSNEFLGSRPRRRDGCAARTTVNSERSRGPRANCPRSRVGIQSQRFI